MTSDSTSLERLHDIVAPPAAPWWPPAPGWLWVMAALSVIALVWLARRLHRWARNCYRREALDELGGLEQRPQGFTLVDVALLLKRCALSAYPRSAVAALTGRPWVEFLDCSAGARIFGAGVGERLAQAVYQSPADRVVDTGESKEILDAARRWIREHREEFATERRGEL